MPSYRGVDQSEVLRSIHDALELLETHSIGPECQKRIDGLRALDPATGSSKLGAIAAASDDVGLANAIGASGVSWLVKRTSEVLDFHAIQNTGGKGLDVVERLHQWGAFEGAMTMEYNRIDEEGDTWLAAAYARTVEPTESNLEKIAMVAGALSDNKLALATSFRAITKLVEMGAKGAGDDDMKKVFLGLDLHERHITLKTLTALALDGAEASLEFDSPMGRFGVVIDDLTSGRTNWHDPSLNAIREKVEKALEPFWATDEVNMVGIGLITHNFQDKNSPQGIMFGGSKRAAQAVANALPGMKVIDADGHKIAPNTAPHAAKKPQPGPKKP